MQEDKTVKKIKPNELIQTINTDKAPKAIGPYSQGKVILSSAQLLYVSGQLSINPETSEFLHNDDVQLQTEQVLKNIQSILTEAGSDLDHVIKCNVFLDNMDNFLLFNQVYAKYFNFENKPARACIAVEGLPKKAKVEIECIAVIPQN
ncbi:hypothetical protein IMG5_095210 [Ichthyophthirius multifiliis]|uniref:Uncharacterized protein n=1 Tax=Ichthyophthirius multifiliis TaxID=5932 RepID=G0QRM6_ICHMU|nr:hypothetical protein IMG5_095210 [Ichthyophthirius multifiliis]EGR32125.1 hypothetical protein IMG5_095210 [Ichthyophthirius multifiliis]|eukprot:XP_004035611.1 hypothetical protein IMG5_095210 [Ichthyophthirius multifiliis]